MGPSGNSDSTRSSHQIRSSVMPDWLPHPARYGRMIEISGEALALRLRIQMTPIKSRGRGPQMDTISFQVDPARYRHWDVSKQASVMRIHMNVDPQFPLQQGYDLKLISNWRTSFAAFDSSTQRSPPWWSAAVTNRSSVPEPTSTCWESPVIPGR